MSLQGRNRYEANKGTYWFSFKSEKREKENTAKYLATEFNHEICHIFSGYGLSEHSKKTYQIDYSHQVQSTSSYCLLFCALMFWSGRKYPSE